VEEDKKENKVVLYFDQIPKKERSVIKFFKFIFSLFLELVKWGYGKRCTGLKIRENFPHVSGNSEWMDCKGASYYTRECANI
jgi:hypothetical protein